MKTCSRDGTRGSFYKRYKLLNHLGSGGISNVYLAEHVLMQRAGRNQGIAEESGERHILSRPFPSWSREPARGAGSSQHRPCLRRGQGRPEPLHGHGVCRGPDLQIAVKQDGPLPYARAADYIRQAAEGLDRAHHAGLIHRHVKPANLLVDPSNVVKVLDPGLAKFSGDDWASFPAAYNENVLGSADYLAPEQAMDNHGVDARTDIYSLGCTFYFLLTGHPPFPEGHFPSGSWPINGCRRPKFRLERKDTPEELAAILMKMMAKQAADRYQSGGKWLMCWRIG